jgi:adenosylcobyric acid synthase
MGETKLGPGAAPWIDLARGRDGRTVADGARDESGRVFGTYVHGLFDSAPLCAWLVNHLRGLRGLGPLDATRWKAHRECLSARYDGLAELLRTHVDLAPVHAALERRHAGRVV